MDSGMVCVSMNRQADRDPRAGIRLADDLAASTHGLGTLLNAVQAKMLPALTAGQGNGRIESAPLVGNIKIHLLRGNIQT